MYALAFSPDGRWLAFAGKQEGTHVWDLHGSKRVATLKPDSGYTRTLDFSPDSSLLASGDGSGDVKVWRVRDWKLGRVLELPKDMVAAFCVKFSLDGSRLVSSGRGGIVWETTTWRQQSRLADREDFIIALAFDPRNAQLASGCRSDDGSVALHDLRMNREVYRLPDHGGKLNSVDLIPRVTATEMISLPEYGSARLWRLSSSECEPLVRASGVEMNVRYSPDGRFFAIGSNTVPRLYDARTGDVVRTFEGRGSHARVLCFSPDGRSLATGSWHEMVRLWDVATGQETSCFQGHTSKVTCVAFSPDGKRIVSSSYRGDATVRVWDVSTGKQLGAMEPVSQGSATWCVAFSPTSDTVAVGDDHGQLTLWDAATFALRQQVQASHEAVRALAYSPIAPVLATGGGGGTIQLWHSGRLDKPHVLRAHRACVSDLSFSADGSLLTSCGGDGQICLWRRTEAQRSEARDQKSDSGPEIRKTTAPPAAPPAVVMPPEEAEKIAAKIRTYFPTPAMKEAIRRLIEERRKPFKDARVITVRQDGEGDFTTIQAAVNAARNGDEIVIADSARYRGQVSLSKPGLVLKAADGSRPVVDGESMRQHAIILEPTAKGSCVVGLRCCGGTTASISAACEDAIVALNECTGSRHGILGNGDRGIVVGNVCAASGWGLHVRRRYWGLAALNAFVGMEYAFSGLNVTGTTGSALVMRGNLFCRNAKCGFTGGGGGRAVLSQNVFVANKTAVTLTGESWTHLYGNVFAGNGSYDIRVYQDRGQEGYPSVRSDHNLLQGGRRFVKWDLEAGGGSLNEWQEQLGNDRQSIQGDPKFVDPANYDFRLRPDSPCRGAGPNGTDIGIQWDADADYFYKLLTTPIEELVEEAEEIIGQRSAARDQRPDQGPETRDRRAETGGARGGKTAVEDVTDDPLLAAAKAYDAFAEKMLRSLSSRDYETALGDVDAAKGTLKAVAFAQTVPTWLACAEACQRMMEQALERAETLVGKSYKVRDNRGIGIKGEVLKCENGTLHVRAGVKVYEISVRDFGPVKIAELGGGAGAREHFDQAALLFFEGKEKEGWEHLRTAKEKAKDDAELSVLLTEVEKLWREIGPVDATTFAVRTWPRRSGWPEPMPKQASGIRYRGGYRH